MGTKAGSREARGGPGRGVMGQGPRASTSHGGLWVGGNTIASSAGAFSPPRPSEPRDMLRGRVTARQRLYVPANMAAIRMSRAQFISTLLSVETPRSPRARRERTAPKERPPKSKAKSASPKNVEELLGVLATPKTAEEAFVRSMVAPCRLSASIDASSSTAVRSSSPIAVPRPHTTSTARTLRAAHHTLAGMAARSSLSEEAKQRAADRAAREEAAKAARATWYAINWVKRQQENALIAEFIASGEGGAEEAPAVASGAVGAVGASDGGADDAHAKKAVKEGPQAQKGAEDLAMRKAGPLRGEVSDRGAWKVVVVESA